MTERRLVVRTAPEIIAFHFGWNMPDVSEGRYQPTRYSTPSIYVIGDDYYAAPSNNKPPTNMKGAWREIGEHYGRKVWELKVEDRIE
jgi:hypothetical protein